MIQSPLSDRSETELCEAKIAMSNPVRAIAMLIGVMGGD
jgi:hypothetical protein